MPKYDWPEISKRTLLGKRISRLDGPEKASGRAKYASDLKRPGQLYAKFLRSPYAHAKVVSIDTSAAEKMPGVKAVKICQGKGPGGEIQWALDEVVGVVAVDEQTAEDALKKIVVKYEKLPHLVNERDISKAGDRAKPGHGAQAARLGAGLLQEASHGFRGHIRGAEPLASENMAFLDSRALDNPGVARVDHARKFCIGEQIRRQIAVNSSDRGSGRKGQRLESGLIE